MKEGLLKTWQNFALNGVLPEVRMRKWILQINLREPFPNSWLFRRDTHNWKRTELSKILWKASDMLNESCFSKERFTTRESVFIMSRFRSFHRISLPRCLDSKNGLFIRETRLKIITNETWKIHFSFFLSPIRHSCHNRLFKRFLQFWIVCALPD